MTCQKILYFKICWKKSGLVNSSIIWSYVWVLVVLPNCREGEGGSYGKFWEKNSQARLIIIREWAKNNHTFYEIFIIPLGVFYPTPLQLAAKEYLTCWKIICVYIKPNWRYCLRMSLQCYRKNIVDLIWQGTLHRFFLPQVSQGKPMADYSFSLSDL